MACFLVEVVMNDYKMTPGELRATWGLGTVFSLRMLGMFMVLPVLTTYGMALQGASEALIGLAIGIYGLAQAVFQIPFGLLSDRVGRKPLIVGGLLVFVLGSIIAALSHSIWGIILGRALQGSGAIAAAVMALLSDLTREQNRTKAMAFIGVSFGVTARFSPSSLWGEDLPGFLPRTFGVRACPVFSLAPLGRGPG
jgi:MFS family permease